jgi:hypothetical protein
MAPGAAGAGRVEVGPGRRAANPFFVTAPLIRSTVIDWLGSVVTSQVSLECAAS